MAPIAAEDGQRHYDAQAQVAQRFYREAIDKDAMTTSPRGDQDALRQCASPWAEVGPAVRPLLGAAQRTVRGTRPGGRPGEESGREQRTADDEQSKARREDDPDRAEEHRQASEGAGRQER